MISLELLSESLSHNKNTPVILSIEMNFLYNFNVSIKDFIIRKLMGFQGGFFLILILGFLSNYIVDGFFHHSPVVHDEFSNILMADTFLEGRLANSPHPHREFFETFHVIQEPSYASKYTPGNGIPPMLGRLLSGREVVGSWIIMALAAALTYWMLLAFLPPGFAFAGGMLVVLSGQYSFFWGTSLWGGAFPMLGGALLFGAFPRMIRNCSAFNSVLFALGAGILSITRPFEGLLAFLPAAGIYIFWLFKKEDVSLKRKIIDTSFPAAMVLFMIFLFHGYYNFRVSGSAVTFPYTVWEKKYSPGTNFVFSEIKKELKYVNPELKRAVLEWVVRNKKIETPAGFLDLLIYKFLTYQRFFFSGISLILLTGLLVYIKKERRDPWLFFAIFSVLSVGAGLMLLRSAHPHYAAPVACPVIYLTIVGAREFWRWDIFKVPYGKLVLSIVILISLYWNLNAGIQRKRVRKSYSVYNREELSRELKKRGGKHLVFVKYRSDHNVHDEWVYNRADIDNSDIAWARYIDKNKNDELIQYLKWRRAWIIYPDFRPLRLIPY